MFLFRKKEKESLPENIIRERIRFYGRVQNVGFRYEVHMQAQENGVTGNVMNCDDGTVLAELQGTREAISAVEQALHRVPRFRIDSTDALRIPVKPNEKGFRYLN